MQNRRTASHIRSQDMKPQCYLDDVSLTRIEGK